MEKEDVQITFNDIDNEFRNLKYGELLRGPKAKHTERYIDGCYYWNDVYWSACDPNLLLADLTEILIKLGEVRRNRQDLLIKNYIAHFAVSADKIDVDTDFLLVILNGVIDLRKLLICWKLLDIKTIEELYKMREKWFFPHIKYKNNHLTHIANVSLPDNFDSEKYSNDIKFFLETLLVTFGQQKESYEWFMTFMALSLTGDNTGNTFCNLYGKQNTGKSTIKDFLEDLFGNYFQAITTDCLFKETFNNLEQLYRCRNAKIVNVSEPNNERKDVSLLKRVTGHDYLVFDHTSFCFKASIIIDSNHLITPREIDSGGFDRRYAVLPCGPVVKNPDSELLEKLKVRKESFLMELLLRYVIFMEKRETSNITLEKPDITKRVFQTISRFKNPIQWFFDTWCTAFPSGLPYIGGKDIQLSEIRAIFMQSFIEFYNNEFEELYFASTDFYTPLTSISAQKFDEVMKSLHFNYEMNHQGRATVFHNFIVEKPKSDISIKEIGLNLLVQGGYASDIQAAETIIQKAAAMPVVLKTEDIFENNYTDLMDDFCFPSFSSFGIIASKKLWIDRMIIFIISTNALYTTGNPFTNWLYQTIEQDKALEIYNKMRSLVSKNQNNPPACFRDPEVLSILNTLFSIYVESRRKAKKKISNNGQEMIKHVFKVPNPLKDNCV